MAPFHGHRRDLRRRADSQLAEIGSQVGSCVTPAQFDYPDGLPRTGRVGRILIQFGDLGRCKRARRSRTRLWPIPYVGSRHRPIVEAEHGDDGSLQLLRDGDFTVPTAVAHPHFRVFVVCQRDIERALHLLG